VKKRSKGNQQSLREKSVPSVDCDRVRRALSRKSDRNMRTYFRVVGTTDEGVVVEYGEILGKTHSEKLRVIFHEEIPFEDAFLFGFNLHVAMNKRYPDKFDEFFEKYSGSSVERVKAIGEELERQPPMKTIH